MMNKKLYPNSLAPLYSVLLAIGATAFPANAADIKSITTGRNSQGAYEVQIGGSDFQNVRSYSLNNPARIVVDIPGGRSKLAEKITEVSNPVITNVAVIEGEDRVRATINLTQPVPYHIDEKNNRITVVIEQSGSRAAAKKVSSAVKGTANVDFGRGAEGQGKLTIKLPSGNPVVDVTRSGSRVILKLQGATFAQQKRMNVVDFGTPVKSIDVYKNSVSIDSIGEDFDIVSYQNDDSFSVEFSKISKDIQDQSLLPPGDSKRRYDGEPLSLNFQDIEVRAVLQLIGDFTNTNVVVSDAVSGSITLRLNNVPWDQALDIILQTKGLSMQKNGDVIFIAPSNVIAENKRAAYAVTSVEKELAPLQQQLIQVQYARAENLEKIIEDNRVSGKEGQAVSGLLSARGSISVDPRTNTLIVNDVPSSIDKVQRLVADLDVPVNQVLIDSRIVSATNNFAHEIGIRWGGAFVGATDRTTFAGSGSLAGANTIISSANNNIASNGQAFPTASPSLNNRLGVDLGATNPVGQIGLQLLGADFMLDLELSALEDEGRVEVISSPRIITQDGSSASIKQSVQIPFTTRDESGNAIVEFKDVPLSLDVTPKIAPNQMVDMILDVKKDTQGATVITAMGPQPSINTNNVKTQVLVDNGETVVLGGVYEQRKSKSTAKVPVLGDLPIVGRAFKKDTNNVDKSELLIFITPKIVDKRYVSRDKFSDIRK